MEYVFGEKGEIEILKTKGDSHSDLTGLQTVMVEYPDQKITDTFRVVRKIDSQEDVEGNCYDWYEIEGHYRVQDRIPMVEALKAENAALVERNAALEDTICELDSSTDERITNAEDSICELDILVDELMNGGNS